MKVSLSIAVVLAASSAALAVRPLSEGDIFRTNPNVPGFTAPVTERSGTDVDVILLTTIPSIGESGDPANIVADVDLLPDGGPQLLPGQFLVITGVGWNVTLEAFAPSLLDDMQVEIGNTNNEFPISLAPGAGVFASGTQTFSSGAVLKFADFGFPNVALTGDVLRLQFSEFFDDLEGADGQWLQGGVLTFQYIIVPTPGVISLAGLAGLVALRRRR